MSINYKGLALHNSACNEVFHLFQDCENNYPARRFLGKCSEFHKNLQACIKKQREIQRQTNLEISKKRQQQVKKSVQDNIGILS